MGERQRAPPERMGTAECPGKRFGRPDVVVVVVEVQAAVVCCGGEWRMTRWVVVDSNLGGEDSMYVVELWVWQPRQKLTLVMAALTSMSRMRDHSLTDDDNHHDPEGLAQRAEPCLTIATCATILFLH